MSAALLPGAGGVAGKELTLGVLGGGQLGRMFVHAAQRMGFFTAVLDPDPQSPAGRVSHHHVQAPFTDEQALRQMAQHCVAITTEFENVPSATLAALSASCVVAPGAHAVAIAQDRIAEKAHFSRCGVACAPYAVLETDAHLTAVDPGLLPGILKTARMGYDGKGQIGVTSRRELAQAWDKLHRVPCVLEQKLPLQMECSVIVARGHDGQCVHLPVQRNLHRAGILAVTQVFEGHLAPEVQQKALAAAYAIAQGLQYVGVLCVEFFVLEPHSRAASALGPLVVNEMAPRPHNSGHYSLDACDISQFDLQVRTLARLPLVPPRQHSAAIMLNLLGDLWSPHGLPPWDDVLALPGAHLHLYGKARASPGRKMGHLTLTAANAAEAGATAQQAARMLGIAEF